MKLYFNTSALNRPFDDLTQPRVRSEAEAVASLLAAAEAGRVDVVGSDYLDFEVGQNPDLERAARVASVLRVVKVRVAVTKDVADRARELEALGLRGLDALHVAAAESGGADLLVTTDDRMLARARRAAPPLRVRVLRPEEAIATINEGP